MNHFSRAKKDGRARVAGSGRAPVSERRGAPLGFGFVAVMLAVGVFLTAGRASAQTSSGVEAAGQRASQAAVTGDTGAWPLQPSQRPRIMPEGTWAVDVRWRAVSTDIDRFVRDNFLALTLFGRWAPLDGLELGLGVPTTVAPEAMLQGVALTADYRLWGGREEGLAFVLSAGGLIPVQAQTDGTAELSLGTMYWPSDRLALRVDVSFVEILGPNRLDMVAPVSVLFALSEALYGVGRVGLDIEGMGQENRVYPTAGFGLGVGLETLEGGASRGDIELGVHLPNLVEDFGLFELRLDWRTYW